MDLPGPTPVDIESQLQGSTAVWRKVVVPFDKEHVCRDLWPTSRPGNLEKWECPYLQSSDSKTVGAVLPEYFRTDKDERDLFFDYESMKPLMGRENFQQFQNKRERKRLIANIKWGAEAHRKTKRSDSNSYSAPITYTMGPRFRYYESATSAWPAWGLYRPEHKYIVGLPCAKFPFGQFTPQYNAWQGQMRRLRTEIFKPLWEIPFLKTCLETEREACVKAGIPFYKGFPLLQSYVTQDFRAKIHSDHKDLENTMTALKNIHEIPLGSGNVPLGTVNGGEWCQASHREGFVIHDEDIFFFNARFRHACAEVVLTGAAHRWCWGIYANKASIDHAWRGHNKLLGKRKACDHTSVVPS
ncbi:hypothetical protein CYMTET_3648 [Cymbomonas tetramitiformis]|uniref:Uncharacterized protein n=1 Tax=Cymbomonas tetramitiformis TaxID=36881 RepID=A0AAE0H2P6_9CHLO|nr:hypothetical protein CYMTET_3648 [Cymbomonas tetramitiformis]